jgi:hypothetical protein
VQKQELDKVRYDFNADGSVTMTRDGDQITSNKNTTLQIKKDNSVLNNLL